MDFDRLPCAPSLIHTLIGIISYCCSSHWCRIKCVSSIVLETWKTKLKGYQKYRGKPSECWQTGNQTSTYMHAKCVSVLVWLCCSNGIRCAQTTTKTYSFFSFSRSLSFNELEHAEYTCNRYKYTRRQTNEWMPNCCWINYSPQLRWLKNDFTFDGYSRCWSKEHKKNEFGDNSDITKASAKRMMFVFFSFFNPSLLKSFSDRGRHHRAHRMQ